MTKALSRIEPAGRVTLSVEAQELIRASKADNTKLAYSAARRDFEDFCRGGGVLAFPASVDTVVAYLEFLSRGQSTSTVEVKLAAIHFWHSAKELPDPTKHVAVRELMEGIRRTNGTAAVKKDPVTLDVLAPMAATCDDSLTGIRNRAILLLGYAGAFRRSELVGLAVADVRLSPASARIQLRRSKTDQRGEGRVKVIPRLDDDLCPVRALARWLSAAGITSGPIFRPIDRWGKLRDKPLTGHAVATIVKAAAESAGLDPAAFSGHSLRAGFATQSALAKTAEWEIQEVTGHRSQTILRGYIRDAGVGQMRAIRRAFGQDDEG